MTEDRVADAEPGPEADRSTRERLIEAATRAFAERGVTGASLLDISRQAGQRNRGAVHYHFGSREGVLVAVLEQQADFLARRELELLAVARTRDDDDLASVLEAIVRPTVELAETGWQGRCYLVIAAEVVEADPASFGPDVVAALARTGGYEVYALLAERVPGMPEALRAERGSLVAGFILRAVADRARALEQGGAGRPQLPTEDFVRNLVNMAVGMYRADV